MARYRRFNLATRPPDDIEAIRQRRAGLRSAMGALEHALAAPARSGDWIENVREALDGVHDVWTRHVVDTEAPGAFLDELVEAEPRLANQVQRLREEHGEILSVLLAAEDDLATGAVEVALVRTTLNNLLAALMRHRQRGADLVYEAYDVDVGGGG